MSNLSNPSNLSSPSNPSNSSSPSHVAQAIIDDYKEWSFSPEHPIHRVLEQCATEAIAALRGDSTACVLHLTRMSVLQRITREPDAYTDALWKAIMIPAARRGDVKLVEEYVRLSIAVHSDSSNNSNYVVDDDDGDDNDNDDDKVDFQQMAERIMFRITVADVMCGM